MKIRPRIDGRWAFVLPLLSLVAGAWLFRADRSDVRVAFERAKDSWRSGRYEEATSRFLTLETEAAGTAVAPECLWEVATIYYYNLYDISNALHYFERLIAEYPDSSLAVQSHLKLAEIFGKELNEIQNSAVHLVEALAGGLDEKTRWEVQMQLADAHFKLNDFALAYEEFVRIASEPAVDTHLGHRARLRISAIHQIRREYEESIAILNGVLASEPCPGCRLQAQLGLIESYEVLDRLDEAIRVAENISPESYPSEKRELLLERLRTKRKYYSPGQWNGF